MPRNVTFKTSNPLWITINLPNDNMQFFAALILTVIHVYLFCRLANRFYEYMEKAERCPGDDQLECFLKQYLANCL